MIYARTLNFTYVTTSRSWKYRAVVIGDVCPFPVYLPLIDFANMPGSRNASSRRES